MVIDPDRGFITHPEQEAGIEIVTRHSDRAVDELEAAIADASPLSRKINNWEGRWPLNVYRERDRDGLSEAALDRLAVAEAMTLEEYQALIAERARVRAVYARLSAECDGCITLSAPGPAPARCARYPPSLPAGPVARR